MPESCWTGAKTLGALALTALLAVPQQASAAGPRATASRVASELSKALMAKTGETESRVMLAPIKTPTGDETAAAFVTALKGALASEGGIALLDDASFKAAIKEATLAPGVADANLGDLADVAGGLGASVLLTGSVDSLGGSYRANVRAIRAGEGSVLASAQGEFTASGGDISAEASTLGAALRRLADRLVQGLDRLDGEIRYQQFAVLPLEEVGQTTQNKQLGLLVASELTTLLQRDHGLMLVERNQIARIIEELALGQTGLTDPAKTVEFGALAGAQGLVLGTVSEAGDRYLVNARVVSTQNGQVVVAEQGQLPAADLVALSSEAVVLRTRTGAIYRSLLLPGWGQLYNREPVKGALFVAAEVVAAGLAVFFHLRGMGFQQDYEKLQAGSSRDDFGVREEAEGAYGWRNGFIYGALGVHVINLLDAFISGKSFDTAEVGSGSARGQVRHRDF